MKSVALTATLCMTVFLVDQAKAAGATKYPSVVKMIEALGEYSETAGTVRIVKRNPLHIQIMPFGFLTDLPRIAESRVHMAAVETLYRAFIHTSVDRITVTVLPQTVSPGTSETGQLLADLRVTIAATRRQAHALLNQYFPGKDFDDLVNHDVKSKLFDRMTFPDQGEPGVERVFADLAQQGQ